MAFRPKELFRRFIWGKPFHGCNKPLEVISCKLFFLLRSFPAEAGWREARTEVAVFTELLRRAIALNPL